MAEFGERVTGWLDSAIGLVSPRALYERLQWRSGAEQLRHYDAGGRDRLNDGWTTVNGPGRLVDRGYRDTIRARARDLERNSDIQESLILAWERNVVGTGFRLQARVKDSAGNDDTALNQAFEELWEEWCRPRNCDIQARLSFDELCRMAVRRMQVDGGILFVKCYTSGGVAPFCLQMREVDELDTMLGFGYQGPGVGAGNYVVDGIEVDQYGRHMAYWFKTFTPDGFYNPADPQRVPADRVIYLQKFKRPTQLREMSPLSSALTRIRDTNEYVEAVSVQARVAACFAAAIKKIGQGVGLGRGGTKVDDKSGYQGQTLSPGMILHMQPGEEINAINPPALGSSVKDMLAVQQRLASSGQGLSYEAGSRDLSQTNYGSLRQGCIEDVKVYAQVQKSIAMHLLYEVYTELLISASLVKGIPIDTAALLREKKRYFKHVFIGPGTPWIDPLKEAKANQIALDTCQDTLANMCAQNGGQDWQEVIAQRGRERKAMLDAGLLVEPADDGLAVALISGAGN